MNKEELRETVIKKWKAGEKAFYLDIVTLIDQLDEPKPEVLIAERAVEKEPEKPVVPAFVGEWLKSAPSKGLTLYGALDKDIVKRASGERADILAKYLTDGSNQELFARAWLDGYTVEEKKHEVRDKSGSLLLLKDKNGKVVPTRGMFMSLGDTRELTEKEIKGYDERYMAFVEEVTQ